MNYELSPTIDETTAMQLAVQLHNQIEVLKSWERKLRLPFMPTTMMHMQVVPRHPVPTVATVLHVINDQKRYAVETSRLLVQFMQSQPRREDEDRGRDS